MAVETGAGVLAFKPGLAIVALLGAVVSMRYMKDVVTIQTRVSVVLSGALISYFSTPAIIDYFVLAQGGNAAYGIAFAIGLFGLSLTAAVINQIPQFLDDIRKKFGSGP